MPKPQLDTPLMRQWREAKARHPDALVFFRVGDFYELFHEDAEEGARILGLTLTARNNGGAADVPLAGVPARARDEYVQRLVREGRRVAICDQVEDAAEAKGIVRREVVETVTPGAILSDVLLDARRNNYLIAVRAWTGVGDATGGAAGPAGEAGPRYALAAADLSTGEVVATPASAEGLESDLARFEAAELLLPRSWEGAGVAPGAAGSRTYRPDWMFEEDAGREELVRRYRVQSLDGFGFSAEDGPLAGAAGALVRYLADVQPAGSSHLKPPRIERPAEAVALDEMTRRNLELVEPLRPDLAGSGRRAGTLLAVIDETQTPMGARMLRRWLLRPLLDARAIWERQEAVTELVEATGLRRELGAALEDVRDLERLAAKVATGRAGPRDVAALGRSAGRVPALRGPLQTATSALLGALRDGMDELEDVAARVQSTLADRPPANLGDGGVIREGFHDDLDELRATRDGARDFIAALQARERERTGIASLKVGFNKVFGYYLEVTKANLGRVPEDYQRKQTLANAERYVTSELKELESRILGAEDRIASLEARLFAELREGLAADIGRIQDTAERIATVDVLAGLARAAERRGYAKPQVHTGYALEIRAGRHPVVETMIPRDEFIPNDVTLDETARVMILTGPNMAGKSTLLRQVGLIQLLAQIGSWVPAASARLGICDRIFTRVGASDNLARGQSTFMVEMQETAAILNGASERSLVLLDEIGRGTATYDGVSIAWAVTEHIHDNVGAKTVFATHYHELTQLADQLPGVVNANVSVREVGEEIVFLRRLEPGGADRSYGIQVGRLAGLPDDVVARARAILRELEGTHSAGGEGLGRAAEGGSAASQLGLFQAAEAPLTEKLRGLDLDHTTPLDALLILAELRDIARGGGGTERA
ncbi:MAG TPA: DNA mismatch repair protein MutS [Longimicrobiales bacterium]|nr:DNA mismatch repair protein MutS [Longimicrobiales bacterium]